MGEERTGPVLIRAADGDQIKARLPRSLSVALKAAAAANNRSTNAEIIHRLEAYEQEPGMANDKKSATITVRLTDEMKVKLESLAQRGPYKISITSIIERGIELAAEELAKLK